LDDWTKRVTELASSATSADPVQRATAFAVRHRRTLTIAGGVLVVAAAVTWFMISAKSRREAFAGRALRDAQSAISAGNAALAMSDLSRLVQSYGGTAAAGEGALLLAQTRLSQGQTDEATAGLREFLDGGPDRRFAAAGYGLLGAALEQAGRYAESAEAHEAAAERWPYEYLRAQSLLEAGRTFQLAGDTGRSAAAYQRVLDQHRETPFFHEAQLRLGEVRPERVSR